MPPRYLTCAIIAFWLGTTTWLFVREIRPRLWPEGPPPYSIDLTEEAQRDITTHWTIYRNNQDSGYCRTWVRYHPSDDTFELTGEFKLWMLPRGTRQADLVIQSMYRVTREGQLRGITARLTATLANVPIAGTIEGAVKNGLFSPRVELSQPFSFAQELKPVPVASGGSVLNPLQPLNRLPGLRKGQRWQIPLVDPLSDLAHKYIKEVAGTLSTPQVRVLNAEVLPETKPLPGTSDDAAVPCLVIEYRGEDTQARTWVRASDGVVLRQEITQDREQLVLVRD